MGDARHERLAGMARRGALTQLIEQKVRRLDMRALVRLAGELDIPVSADLEAETTIELTGQGIGPVISAAESGRRLEAITTDDVSSDWAESELLGAGELAERLNIARATLDNWRKARKILGFRKGLRNFVYPARQFERFRPLDGLDRVANHFPTPEDTWEWLVIPNRSTRDQPPIERLRAGEAELVFRAAEGALDYA